jgi:hypothetical protein
MEEFDSSEIDALSSQELINLFNDFLYDLLKQLTSIIKNDEDLTHCFNVFRDVVKIQQTLVIDQFNINVLEYYDKIKTKDIEFFMNENTSTSKFEGTSVVSKIFKFKKLFQKLSKKEQDMFFYYLNILCYIGARYFTLSNK